MPSVKELGNTAGDFFGNMFASGSGKYMIYVGWFIWGAIILAICVAIYYWIMYKYKVTIFEGSIEKILQGDKEKFIFNIRRITRDRAMPMKDKGIAKWRLLFNWNKKIEPINFKYIQPNNHVFLYKTGPDTFNPMPVIGGNPSAQFEVDPFDRAFLNLGVQNDAREYMKDTDVKRAQVWMFVSGLIILIAVVLVCWLILKYSANTAGKIEMAGNALKNFAGGVAPN